MAETRRRYDSPVRRRRAEETRERIIAAGAAILHDHAVWDWDALTFRAVAERAGVSERTVYRHFPNERLLRDGVLELLEHESGLDLGTLTLEQLLPFAQQLLGYVASFPLQSRVPEDPTLSEAGVRKREAVLAAVAAATPGWDDRRRRIASAAIDVLWSVGTHERLRTEWDLDGDEAIATVTWVISLVQAEVWTNRPPDATTG